MPTPRGKGEFARGEPRRRWQGQSAGAKAYKMPGKPAAKPAARPQPKRKR